ncbi:MAG TPA: class I SAM-dependent methyltransferase [Terriglobales bacterium]|nr:class I SAM-dependent methyltransferase [Terriglobales bacterium]
MSFTNVYDSSTRADAYAKLEFANTYHLAFRDLPQLYRDHVKGAAALDFGCGTGRSTRFLRSLGYTATGIDISEEMLARARKSDPEGDYRLIPGDDMSALPPAGFALIQSAFTFDNIPGKETKARLFRDLRVLLASDGILVNIVSTPEIYRNEWASFSTKDFPENRHARPGDQVRIITTDFEDSSPAVDILWPHESYVETYAEAGLEIVEMRKPLASNSEPYHWISETRIAPWAIYVLRRSE